MSFPPPSTFVHPTQFNQTYQPIPYSQYSTEWSSLTAPDQPLDEPYEDTEHPSPPTHSPDVLAQPLSTMRLAPRKGRGKRKATTVTKKRGKGIRTPALPSKSPRSSRRGRAESPDETYAPIQLKNACGPLLPAPPGSRLEVNDLLILHPPKLSPDANVGPINQYTSSEYDSTAGGVAGISEGYMSRFEMYTCRLCSKTYDGKNARSVARRHLQDKHGVPLALQKRRSRWDLEPERPKTAEMKAKTLQSKRQWAAKNRQHTRLERTFAVYLSQFGPAGLITPCGLRLVAPDMRGVAPPMRRNPFPNGQVGWGQIPADLIEGIKTLRALEHAPDGSARLEAFGVVDEMKVEESQGEAGPSRQFPSTRTPLSDTRSFQPDGEEAEGPRWNNQWYASATHVDDHALQAAIAQHIANAGEPSDVVVHEGPSQGGPYPYAPQASNNNWYYTEQREERLERMDPESDFSDIEEEEKVDHSPIGTMMPWHGAPQDAQLGVPYYAYYYPPGSQMPFAPYTLHQATIQHLSAGQFQPYVVDQYYANQQSFDGEYDQGAQVAIIEEEHLPDVGQPQLPQDMEVDRKEPDVPSDAVAAETLLEIHSTPARTDTHIPSSILRHLSDDTPARPSPLKQSTSDPISLGRSLSSSQFKGSESESRVSIPISKPPAPKPMLLDAPEIKEVSRPRPVRAMSLIAKVAPTDKTSETMSRSISFGGGLESGLDDPFALSPTKSSRKRRSTIASPPPLIKRKKDELLPTFTRHHSQQIFREQENLPELQAEIKNGIKDCSSGPVLALAPDVPSSPPLRFPLQALKRQVFSTPSRLNSPAKSPARPDLVPGSVGRGWMFSSPGNGETAASLGLAPLWSAPGGYGTPGLKGVVSAETPIEKSIKRRFQKSAMMELENMDESD